MKILITVHILLNLWVTGYAQSNKELEFKKVLQAVVHGFSKQDGVAIGRYINKEVGLYQIDRVGVFDHYNHFSTLSFSGIYPTVLFQYAKDIKLLPLQYGILPTYDCGTSMWSKKGLFVDTTTASHFLSTICKERNKNVPDNIPNKTIQYFFDLENRSRRIVLYDQSKRELVFYLSYLNDKWYLTIVDNASSDCSV